MPFTYLHLHIHMHFSSEICSFTLLFTFQTKFQFTYDSKTHIKKIIPPIFFQVNLVKI